MNNIKLFSCLMVVLAMTNTMVVRAETYVTQPGDVLSLIAEKKRVQSGFLLSTEQIMLTLYQLNKDVFVNGDINQLAVSHKLFIPDNTADYIQLSKTEAQQRLRDKSYLHSLVGSTNALNSTHHQEITPADPNTPHDYSQVLHTLETHQQDIKGLKTENERLTKKFNLLERALGRVVLIQGLLTNDLVQLKTGKTELTSPDQPLAPAVESKLFEAQPDVDNAIKPQSPAADIEPVTPAVENKASVIATGSNTPNATATPYEKALAAENAKASPVTTKITQNNQDNTDFLTGSIIVGLFLITIAGWWFFNFHKTRPKKLPTRLGGDNEGPNAPPFNLDHFNVNPGLKDEVIVPVKSIIEKSQKAVKESERENELGGVLELLDMCLLCGDYQQAHAVTVKALAEHRTSAILAKKLSFIERKMAKL
jgi:hypothetical protein